MPTHKILANLQAYCNHEFKTPDPAADPPVAFDANDPSRIIQGEPQALTLFEAYEAGTLSGLRWSLDAITANESNNAPFTAATFWFFIQQKGTTAGVPTTTAAQPVYQPVGDVIGWGTLLVARNGSGYATSGPPSVHVEGRSKAQRKLKPGDKLLFGILWRNEWGGVESIRWMTSWARGMAQAFFET